MWKALYDSPFWLPILPSAIALGMLALVASRALGRSQTRPALGRSQTSRALGRSRVLDAFVVGTALLATADGWLGGPWSPLPASGALTTASVVFFVVAGDLRYFLATRLGVLRPRAALLRATALAFVIPIASQLGVRVPFPEASPRILFLTYELGLLVVVLADSLRAPRDAASRALRRFEVVQYALWASADVLLLCGIEAGYALRIVPNVLYYAAFVPFAARVLRSRFPADGVANE